MIAGINKILVLAPHTDDGELGCGASMARFCREGKEVFYVAFSTCKKSLPAEWEEETLSKECRAALKHIGVNNDNISIFDYEVREFPAKRQEILEELIILNKKIQPQLVLIPSATDIHQDHQVIHNEAMRAFKYTSVWGYELPWNHSTFNASAFIRLTETDLDAKVKAVSAYRSQAHRNYTNGDFIRSLARVRGVQSKTGSAEAFEVYRLLT
jgi:N-acetylglucosamine malate deacetylase 1